ncbi:hypothetical protein JMN32_08760 [Fulvivirga sp. 29W222]|uniref:Uncharacterized protein n=1 Tax=Fulvivirga marina TaxID=2494733 RepID=A0A937G0S5_9BACT|nr:hypothetical protein [Fulvivirga marina]
MKTVSGIQRHIPASTYFKSQTVSLISKPIVADTFKPQLYVADYYFMTTFQVSATDATDEKRLYLSFYQIVTIYAEPN